MAMTNASFFFDFKEELFGNVESMLLKTRGKVQGHWLQLRFRRINELNYTRNNLISRHFIFPFPIFLLYVHVLFIYQEKKAQKTSDSKFLSSSSFSFPPYSDVMKTNLKHISKLIS